MSFEQRVTEFIETVTELDGGTHFSDIERLESLAICSFSSDFEYALPYMVEQVDAALMQIAAKSPQNPAEQTDRIAAAEAAVQTVGEKNNCTERLLRLLLGKTSHIDWIKVIFQSLFDKWRSTLEPNCFGSSYPLLRGADVPSQAIVDKLIEVARCCHESAIGRHRILFPVTFGNDHERGALVEALISVVPQNPAGPFEQFTGGFNAGAATPADQQRQVLLAPWTFYNLIEDNKCSLQTLVSELRPALESNATIKQPLHELIFVIDLQPVSPRPLEAPEETEKPESWKSAAACLLSFPGVNILGPSLGVATVLAAWAASQQLSVRSVIATGRIDAKGTINGVGGIQAKPGATLGPKVVAIDQFLKYARQAWTVLFPLANQNDAGSGIVSWQPEYVDSIQSLMEPAKRLTLLTDGFDVYRNDVVGLRRQDCGAIFAEGARLDDVPDTPQAAGFTAADRADVDQLAARLVEHLKDASMHAAEFSQLPVIVLPFDESPRVVSDRLMQKLCKDWWQDATPDNWVDLPVILPLTVSHWPAQGQNELAASIAAAIQARFPQADVTEDAVQIALHRPGKLVLVVDDLASVEFANIDDDEFAARQSLWMTLRHLGKAPRFLGCPQIVVAICSDEHHKRMWLAEHTATGSAASEGPLAPVIAS